MKKLLLVAFLFCFASQTKAQYFDSATLLSTSTTLQLPFVPGINPEYSVEYYKIVYNTVDVFGMPTLASGGFAVPVSDDCVGFPVAVYQHGTTLNKENVPSRENGESDIVKLFASTGFYVAAPDYIGMGDSEGLHPYVHAATEATAGRDLIRAVKEFIAILNEDAPAVDNGEVFITGYSQGGHAAMALHKHIEDNDLLDEFDVKASAPASGPYNLSGAQTEVILSDAPYSNPGYLVYLIAGYELAYGNLYDTYSDFLNDPYDGIVVPFFDGNNTTLSMGELNPQLPNQISELMTAPYLDDFTNDLSHPLRVALADNDNYDWAPQVPVKMYYCTADEQVNFQNALDAEAAMNAAGAVDVEAINSGPLTHGLCVIPALSGALNWFSSLKTDCVVSGIDELNTNIGLSPNPVQDMVKIGMEKEFDLVNIHTVDGRLMMEKNVSSTKADNSKLGRFSWRYFKTCN